VRWCTPPREIAALVTDSSRESFAAELFHFGLQPRKLDAELFLLGPGEYEISLKPVATTGAQMLLSRSLRVDGPRTRISFELPARRLCSLKVLPRNLSPAPAGKTSWGSGQTNLLRTATVSQSPAPGHRN
jgi:hypothetical protein